MICPKTYISNIIHFDGITFCHLTKDYIYVEIDNQSFVNISDKYVSPIPMTKIYFAMHVVIL